MCIAYTTNPPSWDAQRKCTCVWELRVPLFTEGIRFRGFHHFIGSFQRPFSGFSTREVAWRECLSPYWWHLQSVVLQILLQSSARNNIIFMYQIQIFLSSKRNSREILANFFTYMDTPRPENKPQFFKASMILDQR
jgi:hypothetical protein